MPLDFLREAFRFFTEVPGAPNEHDEDKNEGNEFPEEMFFTDE